MWVPAGVGLWFMLRESDEMSDLDAARMLVLTTGGLWGIGLVGLSLSLTYHWWEHITGGMKVFAKNGNDRVNELESVGAIHIDTTMFGGNGKDILRAASGDDSLDGGQGNDRLFGGAGDDDEFGGNGKDTLNGEAGDDHLRGGIGDDEINGLHVGSFSPLPACRERSTERSKRG